MSAGQTGQMMGQMGHVHGTDMTQTKGCPAKILDVYWLFFLSPVFLRKRRLDNLGFSSLALVFGKLTNKQF